MSDLHDRAKNALEALLIFDDPPWKRLNNGLHAFSGLELTTLSPKTLIPFSS
jgi:hypothetical protein